MDLSVDACASYAAAFHVNYKKMWLTWTGENDMNAYLGKAKDDIDAIASKEKAQLLIFGACSPFFTAKQALFWSDSF